MLKKILKIWFWYVVTSFAIYGISISWRDHFLKMAVETADEDRKKELTQPKLTFKTKLVLAHSFDNFKKGKTYLDEWIKGLV